MLRSAGGEAAAAQKPHLIPAHCAAENYLSKNGRLHIHDISQATSTFAFNELLRAQVGARRLFRRFALRARRQRSLRVGAARYYQMEHLNSLLLIFYFLLFPPK